MTQIIPVKHVLQISLCGIFFTGCVTLYKPNVVHSPMLKEKGELNTSASFGLLGSGLYNLQAAYAISDHIGIMADGMYHRRYIHSADSSVEKLNMFFGEAGAGYFAAFGTEKNGLFQCYGGGGYGNTTDRIDNSRQFYPEVNARHYNLFIQPGIALVNKKFQVAFDMRINYVHLYNIHAYLYDKFEWWNTDFRFYSDTSVSFVLTEPTITMKAGGEKLKVVLQLGATLPVVNPKSYFDINTSSMLGVTLIKFSAGISYTFGKRPSPEKAAIKDN